MLELKSSHAGSAACFTFTLSSLTVLPSATTSGFRPALAKDCKNTTLARICQLLRTFLGDLLQFLAFLQNDRHDYSSDILKVVQAERFSDATCLIRSC
jgi:DNA-binding Xre family transcriptional regulator